MYIVVSRALHICMIYTSCFTVSKYVNYFTLIGRKHDISRVTKGKINIYFPHVTLHCKHLPEKEHVENYLASKTTLCYFPVHIGYKVVRIKVYSVCKLIYENSHFM